MTRADEAHPNGEYVQCTLKASSDAALISNSCGAGLQLHGPENMAFSRHVHGNLQDIFHPLPCPLCCELELASPLRGSLFPTLAQTVYRELSGTRAHGTRSLVPSSDGLDWTDPSASEQQSTPNIIERRI
jgi:hypothetical protein